MAYRELKPLTFEDAPSVQMEYRAHRGDFLATITVTREVKGRGGVTHYDEHTIRFAGIDTWDLRCIARSINAALDSVEADIEKTREALRGEE